MIERAQIRNSIFRAIDRVNELSLDEGALVNGESDVLVGEGAALDSMGFVNFVVAVEEEMAAISDRPLDLVQVLNSPASNGTQVSTVGQLIDFLYNSLRQSPRS
jgi:acyl carrier protein